VEARLGQARHADGLPSEVRELPLQSQPSDAVLQARYADLAVLAQPSREVDNHPYGWSTEDVIREAGVPLLIVPAAPERAGHARVAIAWNASVESHRAVADAMPLLQTATHVRVMIVNPKTGARSHGEEPGADIARHLAKHDVDVEVTRVEEAETSLARMLLATADAFAADLIVSGAFGHSRMSEFIFGSTTRELLTGSRVPLLLSR
jgi:nucleotide-binding universal stress UspA family protein